MTMVTASSQIVRRNQRLEYLHQSSRQQTVRLTYKRDLLLSQDPDADADRAWEQIYKSSLNSSESTAALKDNPADGWKQLAQQPLSPSVSIQKAREFYDTELRPQMEEFYNGQYVAIHPESRSYNVQPGYGKAFRELRTQQPLGPIIVHSIGFAGSGLKARLRGEQP